MFQDQNVIVLDLEILNSPSELRTGWNNKRALGISIGCYYDYKDSRIHWFDEKNLVSTMCFLVEQQPVIVSFNGISFDFPLMRAVVRGFADDSGDGDMRLELNGLCDQFKALASASYDILREIWDADPNGKFTRGLNSLGSILAANHLGEKSGDGAHAPKSWRDGRHADVVNYCQDDVYLTKRLLEHVSASKGLLMRRNGPIHIPYLGLGEAGPEIYKPNQISA